MSDLYKDSNEFNIENSSEFENNEKNTEDVYSSSQNTDEETVASKENSYEWNSQKENGTSSSEYHYSYVNGNNENAPHNPNNYQNAYSSSSNNAYTSANFNTNSASQDNVASYGSPYSGHYNSANSQSNSYSGYTNQQPYQNTAHYTAHNYQQPQTHKVKPPKKKKEKKPASRGFIAAMLAVTILASGALGFGGGYIANNIGNSSSGAINITKSDSSNSGTNTSVSNTSTSEIVKKTANSVVEIATESVVTGMFTQQYVQEGAGSGVIISEDGYIITNYHVIEGSSNITVTLRDGSTSYNAVVIGSDEENDIALLKVDATGLSPATFGDSSGLAVGDYVVAIGNPLGELGGTVTDGIISALAREVTIENNNMTLLQTNAQISPGNSGGGLFNANGELIGIVNAKDSATEVEGIAFAIPINTVLDIIEDLKSYGYVTGKVDLGMELMDINSNDTAFYYGLSQTGCYVLSVTKNSNAETAGFRTGDLVTKVNGTEVTSVSDVEKVLEGFNVGDKVKFTIYRSGQTKDLTLTLAEYVPSSKLSSSTSYDSGYSDDDILNRMFGW